VEPRTIAVALVDSAIVKQLVSFKAFKFLPI
jgi:hypothetical protein